MKSLLQEHEQTPPGLASRDRQSLVHDQEGNGLSLGLRMASPTGPVGGMGGGPGTVPAERHWPSESVGSRTGQIDRENKHAFPFYQNRDQSVKLW